MTSILASSFLLYFFLAFKTINSRNVIINGQLFALISLFWLFYRSVYLCSKMLEFTKLFILAPDTSPLQEIGKSQLHLPWNANNSFRNICKHARHIAWPLSRLLGAVQLELGSSASLTGWRWAEPRISAGNPDCHLFNKVLSTYHMWTKIGWESLPLKSISELSLNLPVHECFQVQLSTEEEWIWENLI